MFHRIGSVILPVLLASCASPPPTGQRIVSLNPCTDALLAAVADRNQIAALSATSRQPGQSSMDLATARALPSTGGTVEEVLQAHPALVVTGSFTPPATRAAYARLGIPLHEFGTTSSIADSEAQIRRLAALAGHPDRGEALIARMRAALAAAAPPRGSRPVTALVWQAGGMVPGQGTVIAELLARTGFTNFAAARGLGQAQILPLEQVLADPPQVILVAGNARTQEDRLLHHPALDALKSTRIVPFDPALEWCAGPTVIRAAARLAQIRQSLPS